MTTSKREYKLSILLPSAAKNVEKLQQCLMNLNRTIKNWNDVEVVMCLDADKENKAGHIFRSQNMVTVYENPSKYRGRFFNAAWKASTGRWLLMANDDILFKTKEWDTMIPYDQYPDDLVTFGFRDNQFNDRFFCHPVWSRKAMEIGVELFGPDYWITKCDNTIWDIHPPNRRVYLPEIELEHKQTPYGPEWQPAYDHDNRLYLKSAAERARVLNVISEELGLNDYRVLIGITTAEYARRADFYDYINALQKPINTIQIAMHGQSIAFNRNEIVKQALAYNCTHIMFIDDDVLCRPNIIYKLLEHKKDIVCALQLRRHFPHEAIVFGDDYRPLALNAETKRLVKIKGAGLGSCLISTSVFRRLFLPYFRMGQIKAMDQIGEDTNFFQRAHEAGFDAYCDTDARVGHVASVSIWPDKQDGQWLSTYDTSGTQRISIPAPIIGTLVEA